MNRRGEVTTIVIIGVALVALIVGGALPSPIKWLQNESRPNTETGDSYLEETVETPLFYEGKEGQTEIAWKKEKRKTSEKFTKTPKQTIGQKLAGFVASLSWWMIVLIGLGVLVIMIMPPAFIWRARTNWKNAFKNQTDGLKSIEDTTVVCRNCKDTVTIDTKKEAFADVTAKMDKKDIVMQEIVKTELVK